MANPVLSLTAWVARWMPGIVTRSIYRIKPFARMIRSALNQAAPHELTAVKVAGGRLAGVRLVLDLQREKDYWLGTYEPELQTAVRDWIKPGMLIYDVGANIGYVSLLLRRQAGKDGRVLAFEALPANLERLRVNLEISGLGADVEIVPAAVVDGERSIKFLVGLSGGMGKAEGSAGRQDLPYESAIEVRGISLDHFVFDEGNPPPELVKIDIEGGEVLAFPGMRRVLREKRPVIFLEIHGPEAARVAWEELVNAGYRICSMQPGYPNLTSWAELDWKAYIVALPLPADPIPALRGHSKGENLLEALLKYRSEERQSEI